MLVRIEDWNRVRENFTELEKKLLNEAIIGETICPCGVVVDEDYSPNIAIKLKNLIRELHG